MKNFLINLGWLFLAVVAVLGLASTLVDVSARLTSIKAAHGLAIETLIAAVYVVGYFIIFKFLPRLLKLGKKESKTFNNAHFNI